MAEAIEQQIVTEEPPPAAPKRPRGKPRANGVPSGSMPVVAKDIPNPRIRKYYSDHDNPAQKTKALWSWWGQLPTSMQEIIEAHVYREWPVLLDPLEEKEYKYIDKIIGVSPVQSDHDFVDMYGAGDYKIYLNVNPAAAPRRTLAEAWVKCSHDFTKYPPSDNRVINVDNISQTDPANKAYVGWLRSQGKLKDEVKEAKEAEDMAATGNVMAELVKDMAQDRRELTQRLLEKTEQQVIDPPPDPPSPKEVLTDQLAMFKSLKELVPSSDPMEMMRQVVATAQLLVQKDGNADMKPLMDQIDKLREESRATEREMWRSQLADIKEQLRAVKETPPQSNVVLPDGSNLESVIQKIVDRVIDKPEDNPWLDIVKTAMPALLPLFGGIAQRMMAPPQPFPMPPAAYQAGAPQPQQAQLPAPQQPQQQAAPQTQQQGGAYTTGNAQLDMLLMMIQVPLADHLRDGDSGTLFAEYFITDFGIDTHTQLATFGADAITNILYSYPPLGPILKPLKRESVVKFVGEFVNYKPAPEPQPA